MERKKRTIFVCIFWDRRFRKRKNSFIIEIQNLQTKFFAETTLKVFYGDFFFYREKLLVLFFKEVDLIYIVCRE